LLLFVVKSKQADEGKTIVEDVETGLGVVGQPTGQSNEDLQRSLLKKAVVGFGLANPTLTTWNIQSKSPKSKKSVVF